MPKAISYLKFGLLCGLTLQGTLAKGFSASFVKVEARRFQMGSPTHEEGHRPNERQRWETIEQDFYIQTTETTQEQYFSITGHNPSHFKKRKHCKNQYREIHGVSLCPKHPVENLSWTETQTFINLLNKSDRNYTYRLPTEEEWECAARAGTVTAFNLGENISPEIANYDGQRPYKGAPRGLYRGQTLATKSLPNANSLGVYDMHGNVWEWVEAKNPYDDQRILRGGSWSSGAESLRSAYRFFWEAEGRGNGAGFRLVRTRK